MDLHDQCFLFAQTFIGARQFCFEKLNDAYMDDPCLNEHPSFKLTYPIYLNE